MFPFLFLTLTLPLSSYFYFIWQHNTSQTISQTHLKRGLHLSIIPPPLTINKWPMDHFWSRCLPPVSLLQVVGLGSKQSSRILVRALWSFSMKPTLPAKDDFDHACHLGSTVPPLQTTTFNQTNSTTTHCTLFAMTCIVFLEKVKKFKFCIHMYQC